MGLSLWMAAPFGFLLSCNAVRRRVHALSAAARGAAARQQSRFAAQLVLSSFLQYAVAALVNARVARPQHFRGRFEAVKAYLLS